jgi:hypothetical protein
VMATGVALAGEGAGAMHCCDTGAGRRMYNDGEALGAVAIAKSPPSNTVTAITCLEQPGWLFAHSALRPLFAHPALIA